MIDLNFVIERNEEIARRTGGYTIVRDYFVPRSNDKKDEWITTTYL